jgi:hypothetical protein
MGRYYTDDVEMQELQDDEVRRKMELDLKMYDFSLTLAELEKLLIVTEEDIDVKTEARRYSGRSSGDLILSRITKIVSNARETLKLCILSNGKFLLFNKKAKPQEFGYFSVPYDMKSCDIWDTVKETMYILLEKNWNSKFMLAALSDSFTRDQAVKWVKLYQDFNRLRQENSEFREVDNIKRSEHTGTLTYGRLENELGIVKATLEEVKVLDAGEEVKKTKVLKTVTITPRKLAFKGLDDHTYCIEVPTDKTWDMASWTDLVYKHRYRWSTYEEENTKASTLFGTVMDLIGNFPEEWTRLSIDGKPSVKIAFKHALLKRGGQMLLSYIDDKRVANESMMTALRGYYYEDKTLITKELPADIDEAQRQSLKRIKETRDELVVAQGIHGYLNDLEGECPIDIAFEKDGVKWNLTIGELKIHLKGGIETIKSIERVLKGTAQGHDARHSTNEMYERLSKVLTQEEAMEIIKTAKTMGKLVQNLNAKGDA